MWCGAVCCWHSDRTTSVSDDDETIHDKNKEKVGVQKNTTQRLLQRFNVAQNVHSFSSALPCHCRHPCCSDCPQTAWVAALVFSSVSFSSVRVYRKAARSIQSESAAHQFSPKGQCLVGTSFENKIYDGQMCPQFVEICSRFACAVKRKNLQHGSVRCVAVCVALCCVVVVVCFVRLWWCFVVCCGVGGVL